MDEFIKSKLPVMDEIIDGIDENLESAMNDLKELKQEIKSNSTHPLHPLRPPISGGQKLYITYTLGVKLMIIMGLIIVAHIA